jgi:hypothetical protein
MQNDLQNAYALSSMEHNAAQAPLRVALGACVQAGLVAVVREDVAYCPFTDAVLPAPHLSVLAVFPSYDEAARYLDGLDADPDDEFRLSLACKDELRPARPAPEPVAVEDEDELPF